ncbi:hypothetical protein [Streptomyces virginiae]|uniref:hypothetical protein n=1 Tax=Streptomyces virginiae TaxID=1961 RepID=UPI00324C2326
MPSTSTSTGPNPDLVDAVLAADYPADIGNDLLAADLATVDAVLDVLDAERQQTSRIAAAWEGVTTEAGPFFAEGDTLGAVLGRMPEEARARVREHLWVLESAGVVQTGPEA